MFVTSMVCPTEQWLLDDLDRQILVAEEAALLEELDRDIRKAETQNGCRPHPTPATNVRTDSSNSNGNENHPVAKPEPRNNTPTAPDNHQPPRTSLVVTMEHDDWDDIDDMGEQRLGWPDLDRGTPWWIEPGSVSGLVFVRVTKLLPRHMSEKVRTPKVMRQRLLQSFLHREGRDLPLTGFTLEVQSANPHAWRLVLTGYESITDAFLAFLGRKFRRYNMGKG